MTVKKKPHVLTGAYGAVNNLRVLLLKTIQNMMHSELEKCVCVCFREAALTPLPGNGALMWIMVTIPSPL